MFAGSEMSKYIQIQYLDVFSMFVLRWREASSTPRFIARRQRRDHNFSESWWTPKLFIIMDINRYYKWIFIPKCGMMITSVLDPPEDLVHHPPKSLRWCVAKETPRKMCGEIGAWRTFRGVRSVVGSLMQLRMSWASQTVRLLARSTRWLRWSTVSYCIKPIQTWDGLHRSDRFGWIQHSKGDRAYDPKTGWVMCMVTAPLGWRARAGPCSDCSNFQSWNVTHAKPRQKKVLKCCKGCSTWTSSVTIPWFSAFKTS